MAQTPEEVAARQAIEAQHLARDDRLLASQRAAVDSAKLVSTFVLALASTLVGTALQISPRASGELTALIITSSGWLRPADRPIFDASACEREEVGLRADPLTLRM